MWRNRIKIAFRNLWKHRGFSLINISGLALGMACCFLIMLYVGHESSYDRFHPELDNLYRIEYRVALGEEINASRIPPTIEPALSEYLPDLDASARFYGRNLSVVNPESNDQFELDQVFFADTGALRVFHFDFVEGDPGSALHTPKAVMVTEETARQLFGTTHAIGKELSLAGEPGFRVTGVVKSWPNNAHLAFNMILPFDASIDVEPAYARERTRSILEGNWIATHSYTYVRMLPQHDVDRINGQLKDLIQAKGYDNLKDKQTFYLMPVKDLHLNSEGGPEPAGNSDYLFLFGCIGLLTLCIACINFINLSTAQSLTRAKEVGVRKVLGAGRGALVGQFLGESMLLTGISFLLALLFTFIALPHLNNLTELEIPWHSLQEPKMVGMMALILVLTGLASGIYPAFFVTKFKPVSVLRGRTTGGQPGNAWFRKGLITIQFLAAIAFIAGAMVVYLQLNYLETRPLGFQQQLVVNLPLSSDNNVNAVFRPGDETLRERMNAFDASLSENPKVIAVTQASQAPGLGAIARNVWNAHVPQEDNFYARILSVDYDYVETFGLEVVAGRDFNADFGTDHLTGFMANEAAVRVLGYTNADDAIGKQITLEGKEGTIVGVTSDFNFSSLRDAVGPLIMEVRPGAFATFSVVLQNGQLNETLAFLEEKWTAFFPEKVFEYTFLDDALGQLYTSERRLSSMIGYFAFLAIFISCVGLLGLAALLTKQRFKEIGIRKVLGASVSQILGLISKDFLILIGLSLIVAAPLTWYMLKDWLSEFAYRIDFPWWVILVSGLTVLLVAFLAVSSQSLRAALSNPVDAIREE